MKNSRKGSRAAPGGLIRAIAAALIVTAISVILEAGPAMAADDASTPPDTAAGQGLAARMLADHVLMVEILAVLAVAALIFAYDRYRRSRRRRHSAHARTGRPPAHDRAGSVARTAAYSAAGDRTGGPGRSAADGDSWTSPSPSQPAISPWAAGPPRAAAGQSRHTEDYPSWPGRPGPYALHPDHPSWPGHSDPRWAAAEAALEADGYPNWPAAHSPRRDAEPRAGDGEPGWPGGGRPAARRQPPPTARRGPYRPAAAAVTPVLAVRDRTGFAPQADFAPRVVITPGPGHVHQGSPAGVMDRVQPEANWVQPERVQVWDAGSVELATWIISEAHQQAADIRHEARDQVASSLKDAKQEAAGLVQKASEQAAAMLATAEQEAAEMQATVTRMSAELGGVAAQVTQNLTSFATPGTKSLTRLPGPPVTTPAGPPVTTPTLEPVIEPEARPATRPSSKPGTRPKSRTAAKPGTRTAARPGTRTAARPKGAPRQLVAARVAAVATAALLVFVLAAGTTEVALHGFAFFVFRSTGTGETGPNGLQEDQGPGQPDAPKATPSHSTGQSSPHSTAAGPSGQ